MRFTVFGLGSRLSGFGFRTWGLGFEARVLLKDRTQILIKDTVLSGCWKRPLWSSREIIRKLPGNMTADVPQITMPTSIQSICYPAACFSRHLPSSEDLHNQTPQRSIIAANQATTMSRPCDGHPGPKGCPVDPTGNAPDPVPKPKPKYLHPPNLNPKTPTPNPHTCHNTPGNFPH